MAKVSDGETSGTSAAVRAAAAYLASHVDEPVPLSDLARAVGLSPAYLQKAFTRTFGTSPKRYQTALRIEALKSRLREGAPVADAVYGAGFGSNRGAYEAAKRQLGMTPGVYRRRGAGLRIRFGVADSALGPVLVGATDEGVCAVMLADDEAALLEALNDEFGEAKLVRDDPGLAAQTAAVVAHVAGGARPDLPLDLRGTDFQRRVWTALQAIPAGSTVTYGELAAAIGRPTAQRAVASACGDNHVAVLVPCHRVVRGDGGLGGYKWGVERKRRLLEREQGREPQRGQRSG
jgi:AraC family transcriptional regulator of adaptative response/methylated-DNA-[protein]-cysteine methyltransferase